MKKYKIYHGEIDICYWFSKSKIPNTNLVVVFPGARFRDNAGNAEYLMDISRYGKVHALYFIDRISKGNTSPYIMKNMDCCIERSFVALINKIVEDYNIDKIIYCGQSAGGKAAMYYGMKYNGFVIASSPSMEVKYRSSFKNIDNSRVYDHLSFALGEITPENVQHLNDVIWDGINNINYDKKAFLLSGVFEPKRYKKSVKKIVSILTENGKRIEVMFSKFDIHAETYHYLRRMLPLIIDHIISGEFENMTFSDSYSKILTKDTGIIHLTKLKIVNDNIKYRRLFRVRLKNIYGKLIKLNFFQYDNMGEVNLTCFFATDNMKVNKLEGNANLGILHFYTNWNSSQPEKWAEFWIEKTPKSLFRGSLEVTYSKAFLEYEDFDFTDYVSDSMYMEEGGKFIEKTKPVYINGKNQIPLLRPATQTKPGTMSAEDKRRFDEMYEWFLSVRDRSE